MSRSSAQSRRGVSASRSAHATAALHDADERRQQEQHDDSERGEHERHRVEATLCVAVRRVAAGVFAVHLRPRGLFTLRGRGGDGETTGLRSHRPCVTLGAEGGRHAQGGGRLERNPADAGKSTSGQECS